MNRSRIHILGLGNIGKLFAHSLRTAPHLSPITLLLHRESKVQAWEQSDKTITLVRDGRKSKAEGYDVELVKSGGGWASGSPSIKPSSDLPFEATIEHLIVATKAPLTANAIASVAHRLDQTSTILFAQNGLGTVEEVNRIVFPDTAKRPRFLASVNSHGLYHQDEFCSVHAGMGEIMVGDLGSSEKQSPAYLSQVLVEASSLRARAVSTSELMQAQLEKLAVNAMINPLTVVYGRRNGELFTEPAIVNLKQRLLTEVSAVIQALAKPWMDSSSPERFSTDRLDNLVIDVARKTALNKSSMLQDVQAGRETEIEYINGYIMRKAVELGMPCDINERLVQMVKESKLIEPSETSITFQAEAAGLEVA